MISHNKTINYAPDKVSCRIVYGHQL